jgi:hypothetical protein
VLLDQRFKQKPGKLHRGFMLKIFRQAMDGLNHSGHDTTLTFNSYLQISSSNMAVVEAWKSKLHQVINE